MVAERDGSAQKPRTDNKIETSELYFLIYNTFLAFSELNSHTMSYKSPRTLVGYNRSVTKPHAVLPIDQPASVSRARTSDKEEPRRKGILMLHDAGRGGGGLFHSLTS